MIRLCTLTNFLAGLAAGALLAAAGLAPAAVVPVQRCSGHAAMLEQLQRVAGETPAAGGLTVDGLFLQVLAPPDGANWSLIYTTRGGNSCLADQGLHWRAVAVTGR